MSQSSYTNNTEKLSRNVSQNSESEFHKTVSVVESEKLALQELNERFASYVDAIRKLSDPDNLNNSSIIDSVNGSLIAGHVECIKEKYENELKIYRDNLNLECTEKLGFIEENEELKVIVKELRKRIEFDENNAKTLRETINSLKKDIEDKESIIAAYINSNKDLKAKMSQLQQELDDITGENEFYRKNAEEDRKKVDLLNCKITSLREHISFQTSLHKDEIVTAYNKVKEFEEKALDSEKPDDDCFTYEELLALREQLLDELNFAKHNVIGNLTSKLDECESELCTLRQNFEESVILKNKYEELYLRLKTDFELEKSKNATLESRLNTIEKDYSAQISSLQHTCSVRQGKILELTDKLHSLVYDYEDMLGSRLALDTELAAYRRLLDSEEKRLNINLSPKKRRYEERIFSFSVNSGSKIRFLSCDTTNGVYIKLINSGKKQINLSNYKIQRKFPSSDKVEEFKLPSKIALPSQETLTVYSCGNVSEAEASHVILPDVITWTPQEDSNLLLINGKGHLVSEASLKFSLNESCMPSPSFKRKPLFFTRLNRTNSEKLNSSGRIVSASSRNVSLTERHRFSSSDNLRNLRSEHQNKCVIS